MTPAEPAQLAALRRALEAHESRFPGTPPPLVADRLHVAAMKRFPDRCPAWAALEGILSMRLTSTTLRE